MRIGIFTDAYDPDLNGVATSAKVLYEQFTKLGHQAYVVCTHSDKVGFKKEGDIIRLPGIELKNFYGYGIVPPVMPLFSNEIAKLNLDIIHIETEFGVGILGSNIAKYLKIPMVRTYHTDYIDYANYFFPEKLALLNKASGAVVTRIVKFLSEDCLRLMTPSKKTRDILKEAGVKTAIDVVPNGINLERFRPDEEKRQKAVKIREELGIKEDEKVLIYLGRIADEKRLDMVIESFAKVKENKLKLKLIVVGLGPAYEKNVKLSEKLGLNDCIFFLGKKAPEEVPLYYLSADGFISASTSETQGLTYIEALSAGLPIIVAYDEVLTDLVDTGNNGFFFNNEDECYEMMKSFVSLSKDELLHMKENAIKSVEVYDAEKFARDTLTIYEEVIQEYKESYQIVKTAVSDDAVKLTLRNSVKEEVTLLLRVDDYYGLGLRSDSMITKEQYEELKKKENTVLAFRTAIRLLANRDYSISMMKTKLKQKISISDEELNRVIEELQHINLLSDEKYAENRISSLKASFVPKNTLIRKLRSEGISNEIISSLYNEQQDEELKIAKKRASRYQLSTRGKSLNYKKQLIFSKLKNDGFSNEICNEAIDSLDFSYEILYEADTLRLESQKAYLKYHNKYEGSQLRNKIYIYLANKGFEQEKIYAVINEMEF